MLKLTMRPHLRSFMIGITARVKIENRMKIVIEHRMPALMSLLQQRDSMVRAGAIDQRVDPAPFPVHLLHQSGGCLRIGNIALNSQIPRRLFAARYR